MHIYIDIYTHVHTCMQMQTQIQTHIGTIQAQAEEASEELRTFEAEHGYEAGAGALLHLQLCHIDR